MTDQSDIVERLRGAAQGWRQEDALEYRVGEEEARLNDEAAAEITRLRAALAGESKEQADLPTMRVTGVFVWDDKTEPFDIEFPLYEPPKGSELARKLAHKRETND